MTRVCVDANAAGRRAILDDAAAQLVHASLMALLAVGCRSHNLPVAVDVVSLVSWRQLLWGLCYGGGATIRAYVDVAREAHFDDGAMHAHRLDLYSAVFWGAALRLCALALPADRRAAYVKTADARQRGDAWFRELTEGERATCTHDGLDDSIEDDSAPAAALRKGRPIHLVRNALPSVRKAAIGAVNAFLRRLLTAREYRGYRVSDVAAAAGPETASCFADVLRRLKESDEGDLDADALEFVSASGVRGGVLPIAQQVALRANGEAEDKGLRVDGPCGFGSPANERFGASMDRYQSMPKQTLQKQDAYSTPRDYARLVGNHDSVAAAVIAEERTLVRAFRYGGEVSNPDEFIERLKQEAWEVSRPDEANRYRRPGDPRSFHDLRDVAVVHFLEFLAEDTSGDWQALQRRFFAFAARQYQMRRVADARYRAQVFEMVAAHLHELRANTWAARDDALKKAAADAVRRRAHEELERMTAAQNASTALSFVNSTPVEVCLILIVIASVLFEHLWFLPWTYEAQLCVSISVSIIFSVELVFRVAAQAALAKSLRRGLDICFADWIRYLDLVCIILEFVELLRLTMEGSKGEGGFRGTWLRFVKVLRFFKFLKAVRLTRLLRSLSVRDFLLGCYLFVQAAFGVVDVIQGQSTTLKRAQHLGSKRAAFRDAQAALLDLEGEANDQSAARVLLTVLRNPPCALRTAALRLATGIVDDANRAGQEWFTERLQNGEVLRVAADEFRATCSHLERHHRRCRAGQRTSLDEALLRGCAWTVKFLRGLLVGQHQAMQDLCTCQASMMAAVNVLQELEHLLVALAGGAAHDDPRLISRSQSTCEKFLVVEVIECFAASMDGACAANQAYVAASGVPDLLAAFLTIPMEELMSTGERDGHLVDIAAYLARRAAVRALDAMVEGLSLRSPRVQSLRRRLPKGVLGRILEECAPVHRTERTPRARPPFDFFGEGSGDLSSVNALQRLEDATLETVAALVVTAHALRVKLWHFGVSDGPFAKLLGEVDVRWRGRVERVFFELPVWAGSLTTVARQRFEQNVDLTSAETRMRQLFEDGEGIIREARYLYRIEQLSKLFRIINKRYIPLKYRLYSLALILNLHLMLSTTGDGSLRLNGNSVAAICLAVPTVLGYGAMSTYMFICKFKTTVDMHVARTLKERAKAHGFHKNVDDHLSRLLQDSRTIVSQKMSSVVGLTSQLTQNALHSSKRLLEELEELPKREKKTRHDELYGNMNWEREDDSTANSAKWELLGDELLGEDPDMFRTVATENGVYSRVSTWEVCLAYGLGLLVYGMRYGFCWGMAVVSAALVGLCLPSAFRKARDNPYTTFDLITIAAYDALTQDLGVCGNFVFVLIAALGFRWQYVWIFLLLDILLISDDLQNVLMSVWIPKAQLVLAFYITLVSIGILSVMTFFVSSEDESGTMEHDQRGSIGPMVAPAHIDDVYDDHYYNNYVCRTPWTCFLRDVYIGLIDGQLFTATLAMEYGDDLDPSDAMKRQANLGRIFIQLIFFIIVTLLLINVFTGIILDTFSSLRETLKERKEMMEGECFVCGADRGTLEEYDVDKEEHEGSEHNKWSYLLYLDHVKRAAADVAPITGVDAHVASCAAARNEAWLPEGPSFKLEQMITDGEGGRADVDHSLKPLYDAIQETRSDVTSLRAELSGMKDALEAAAGAKRDARPRTATTS